MVIISETGILFGDRTTIIEWKIQPSLNHFWRKFESEELWCWKDPYCLCHWQKCMNSWIIGLNPPSQNSRQWSHFHTASIVTLQNDTDCLALGQLSQVSIHTTTSFVWKVFGWMLFRNISLCQKVKLSARSLALCLGRKQPVHANPCNNNFLQAPSLSPGPYGNFSVSWKFQSEFCWQLWNLLMPDTSLERRITKQWGAVGFQGDDPATDFRGMGEGGGKKNPNDSIVINEPSLSYCDVCNVIGKVPSVM